MSYPEQLSPVDRGKFTVKETIEETLITQSDPVYRPNHNEGCTALILCFTICGPFSSPGTAEHAVKQTSVSNRRSAPRRVMSLSFFFFFFASALFFFLT